MESTYFTFSLALLSQLDSQNDKSYPIKHEIFQLTYNLLAASPLASRGFAPKGFIKLIFRVLDFKENIFFWGGGLGLSHPPGK